MILGRKVVFQKDVEVMQTKAGIRTGKKKKKKLCESDSNQSSICNTEECGKSYESVRADS